MNNQNNYTTSISVTQSPQTVFEAIINVRGWWSENIQGSTDVLNSEFMYGYKDVHVAKMKIVELIPNKKVVWLVLENQFNFTKDKNEWKGNRIVFDIAEKDGMTELHFTQEGLVPEYECYNVCEDAWTSYIQGSLKNLIIHGKGNPNSSEGGLNAELVEKWGLPNK
ncbi:MAG: SRPBCC domain-containing protein [Bacteroidetes bacterium]|nr:SRPBCC domain-containing protein [Bacteroidota bacterium]